MTGLLFPIIRMRSRPELSPSSSSTYHVVCTAWRRLSKGSKGCWKHSGLVRVYAGWKSVIIVVGPLQDLENKERSNISKQNSGSLTLTSLPVQKPELYRLMNIQVSFSFAIRRYQRATWSDTARRQRLDLLPSVLDTAHVSFFSGPSRTSRVARKAGEEGSQGEFPPSLPSVLPLPPFHFPLRSLPRRVPPRLNDELITSDRH